MKKFQLALLLFIFVTSCSKPDNGSGNVTPTPNPPQEQITIPSTVDVTPVVPPEGGDAKITFTAATAWTASVISTKADSWVDVNPKSGDSGPAEIKITTTPNNTYVERNATIQIKCGTETKDIVLTQKQVDNITVTTDKVELGAKGGTFTIEIKSNIDFSYEIKGDWIKYVSTKAYSDKTLTFSAEANDGVQRREGSVTVKGGEFSETVKVYQSGEEPTLIITQNEYNLEAEGGSIVVEVSSNVSVTMTIPENVSWITENNTKSVSTSTFHLDVAANETYESRNAQITFSNEESGLSEKISVNQKGKTSIPVASVTLDKNEFNLNQGEKFTLVATVAPEDATDKSVEWSSDNPEVASIDENGEVTAKSAGTATITVTTKDGGKTATCSVTVVATVNFPDEVFRNYMIQNFDLDNDGTISLDEASKVEMISIETTDIESLSGIEYCPELQVLGCCGFSKERGKLKKVDVSKNPKLISLMLDDNSLESLDISRNVNIQGVSCRNNNISSINISDNADLSFLDIRGNSISTLNLSNCKKLNSLYATGNQLTALDLSENQVLEWIEASDNTLENLVLPSSVVVLHCKSKNNHLKTVDFSNTPKLYELVINHTDNIDLSSCTKLKNLHCTDVKNLNISNTNLTYEYGYSEIIGAKSITAKNCEYLEFNVNTSSCTIDTDASTVKVFVYDQIETSIKFGDSKVDKINLETYRNEGDGEKCYGLTRVESKNVSFIDVLDPTYPNVLSFCYGSEDRYDAVPNLKRINFYSAPTEIRLSKKDLSGMINIYSELKKTVYIAKSKLTDFGPYVPITTGYMWKYVESVPIIVNTYTKSIISPEILTTGARETNWTPQKDGYEWHPITVVDFEFND